VDALHSLRASTASSSVRDCRAARRNSHSAEPHIHIFPDKELPAEVQVDTAMDLFPDGRSTGADIKDTVARGLLEDDDLFYRGLDMGGDNGTPAWTTGFPASTRMQRSSRSTRPCSDARSETFNIYCTPCHGYDGHARAWCPSGSAGGGLWQALQPRRSAGRASKGGVVVQMPNGQLFNTISNGYSTMMGYGAQIPQEDRWAIVAYVRALEPHRTRSHDERPGEPPGEHPMSGLTKTLHPDEKIKARQAWLRMVQDGIAVFSSFASSR